MGLFFVRENEMRERKKQDQSIGEWMSESFPFLANPSAC
jgi:hypothetical protein